MARPKGSKNKKGLGDVVEDITKATGIKKIVGECEGCNKRKQFLNEAPARIIEFFRKYKPNEFKEEDRKLWKSFIERENVNTINPVQQQLIIRLLKEVCNMSVKPCGTCNGSVWNKYIDKINTVYDSYS